MGLISIIYSSSAKLPFSDGELTSLLKQSRENNTRLAITAITGLLLYKAGAFMQDLEGEEQTVETMYSKVEKDLRHFGMTQVRWKRLKARRFPDWSMGFKNLRDADLRQTPGYSEFMNEPWTSPVFQADPSRAAKLLLTFAGEH
jgi:hypothetical protein